MTHCSFMTVAFNLPINVYISFDDMVLLEAKGNGGKMLICRNSVLIQKERVLLESPCFFLLVF